MGRTIYTERDIEDLAKQGIKEIQVDASVYITDIAREKMEALGIRAKAVPSKAAQVPVSAASIAAPTAVSTVSAGGLSEAERTQVADKVKSGVIAKLGPGVDATLLDNIIKRVVGQL